MAKKDCLWGHGLYDENSHCAVEGCPGNPETVTEGEGEGEEEGESKEEDEHSILRPRLYNKDKKKKSRR